MSDDDTVTLRHGAGGSAMRALITRHLLDPGAPAGPGGATAMDDGTAIRVGDQWLVITTDSYVVHPVIFPGGDIGRLAVSGTVNDLAMMGATRPLGLTCGLVLEEGFSLETLRRIEASMHATCRECGTAIVTGDTKVMGRGELDGIVINTAGVALTARLVTDQGIQPGDRVVVSGMVGDHGLAVMAARYELRLEGELRSDVAPLAGLVDAVLAAAPEGVMAMKDPTRGGVASALAELAEKNGVSVELDEASIPVSAPARAAAELLGIDPLVVANEGKVVLVLRPAVVAAVLAALRAHPLGRHAALIGTVTAGHPGRLVLDTGFGRRLLVEPDGEPLPRIC